MTNLECIEKFLEGKEAKTPLREIGFYMRTYSGRTLQIKKYSNDAMVMINYSTPIAIFEVEDNTLIILKKYNTKTTSKILNMTKQEARGRHINVNEVDYINIDTNNIDI